MKNTIKIGVAAAGLIGAVQLASAQGYVDLNTYDASVGAFVNDTSRPAPVSGASITYFELLGGPSAGSLTGVVSDTTHSAINPFTDVDGNGVGSGTYMDVGNGRVAGVAGGGIGFFQVLMWEQPSSSPANFANAGPPWESAVWSQVVGNPGTTTPPSPPTPTALAIALNNPVIGRVAIVPGGNAAILGMPEPSILALAGLSTAAWMIRRRKNN